jgi:hypothetical protein
VSGYQMVQISDARDRTYLSGFQMEASIDRFIKKRVIKKYFIHDKTVKASESGFQMVKTK